MSTFSPSQWYSLAQNAISEEKWSSAAGMLTKVFENMSLGEGNKENNENKETEGCGIPTREALLLERCEANLKSGQNVEECVTDARQVLKGEQNNVHAYVQLVSAYVHLKQYGRAEVEVKKALKIDVNNAKLTQLLRQLTKQEERFPSVSCRDGSDRYYREFQGKTGFEMNPNSYAKVVQAALFGDVLAVQRLWKPRDVNLCITDIRNPPIMWPVLGR